MDHNTTYLNLSLVIEQHARLTPDKEAVIFGDSRITYGELNALANQVAHGLRSIGVEPGDKIALSCPNLPYFPIVYYGILKAGCVVVPLNVLLRPREIEYHLSDSDAKAVLVFEGTPELPMAEMVKEAFDRVESCEEMVVMCADKNAPSSIKGARTLTELTADKPTAFETHTSKPDDTALILYTSGTTGTPKGAELTHFNIFMNALVAFNLHIPGLDYTDGKQKTCLITLPLFHTTGQTAQMNAQMFAGHRIALMPRFDAAAALEAFKDYEVNFWTGVPTMYWAILKYVDDNDIDVTPYKKSLLILSSGGAPMPVEVLKAFETKFKCRILEGYGLTETSPISNFNHAQVESVPGTVGHGVFGVDVRCVDDDDNEVAVGERGEVVMRGHNIMKGYYKNPEATAEVFRNGWFHSGDIGVMDESGILQIVDRKKEMVLRGGYNVYPRELEEVIMTHEAVSLVAIIGVPDEKMGEEVKAYVVLNKGFEVTEEEFIGWCKSQIAANKYPRYVEFRDELPIGGTGKIQKLALKEEISGE
jgi:long-chain acyl-CoA synthetase